ncbi:4-azaleucine resistance probable transporter AzlC [Alteribacillus persepolensis]|uniref:4-azaleucine resistance probable transporter AzlC n=1 Tax=Alteribacillus persepolensis TaxID=568899 RepID=A0A1G8H418_9BACI|nr:AzlC family ABC transporter permease [Alteribacillus persepolensis]SDI01311.1 4-azaleucine resistance probable transporter AzlC [Alteribacillus persepolensis]
MKAALTAAPNHSFIHGMKDGVSIALGYFPAAITFGFLAQTTGLLLQEALVMSLLVFAGAAQYMALSLIAAGTGALEIIFTTFIVNIRHFLMSASLNEKALPDHPLKKAGYAFGLTDEVFAVTSTKDGHVSTGYVYGVFLISYASWVVFSGVGHAVGQLLPSVLQQSLTFALYALFIALLAPSVKKHRKIFFLAALAAVVNSIFTLIMAEGWAIISATLIASVVIEWIEPHHTKKTPADVDKEVNAQ